MYSSSVPQKPRVSYSGTYRSEIERQQSAGNNFNGIPLKKTDIKPTVTDVYQRHDDCPAESDQTHDGLFSKFRDIFSKIDIDDIVIIAVIILLFNENPEDDYLILIILAALLFS